MEIDRESEERENDQKTATNVIQFIQFPSQSRITFLYRSAGRNAGEKKRGRADFWYCTLAQ